MSSRRCCLRIRAAGAQDEEVSHLILKPELVH